MENNVILVDKQLLLDLKNQLIAEIREAIQGQTQIKKEWLDSSEVKQIMGWSDSTFRRFCKATEIHKIGGRVYINRKDIEDLLSRHSLLATTFQKREKTK